MYSSHSQWAPAGASLLRARRGRGIAKVGGGWKWEEGKGRGGPRIKKVERGGGRREKQDRSGEGSGEGWEGGERREGRWMVEKEGGRRGICSPYARFVMLGVRRVGGGRGENRSVSLTSTVCQLVTSFSWHSRESLVLLSHKLNVNFHVHEQLHIVFHRKRS